jgi:molybdenum cofactor cytidylyltransferase
MIAARAVILAAGASSRVGRQKLLMEFRGRALIEYPIAAAQAWQPIVVAGPQVATYLLDRSDVSVLRNDAPELGMAHSLSLANRALPEAGAIIVLLGDKPMISASLIEAICRAPDEVDLAYPVRDGIPGHPVVLFPRARRCIDGLPPGDTLRLLRGRAELAQWAMPTQDDGAFFDVDTLGAFADRTPP